MPEGRLIHVDIDEAADGTPVVVVTGDILVVAFRRLTDEETR